MPKRMSTYFKMANKLMRRGKVLNEQQKKKKPALKHFQREAKPVLMELKDLLQEVQSGKRNWLGFIPDDKELGKILALCQGREAEVALILGVRVDALRKRIRASPFLMETLETVRESLLDKSEKVLMKSAHEKEDLAAVFFHLSRKGRSRGFGERVDVGMTKEFKVTVEDRSRIDSLRNLSKEDLLRLEEMNRKIVEVKGKVVG